MKIIHQPFQTIVLPLFVGAVIILMMKSGMHMYSAHVHLNQAQQPFTFQ